MKSLLRRIFAVFFISYFTLCSYAQLPVGFTIPDNLASGDITAMKTDIHGNLYATGYYYDTLVWQGVTYLSHDTTITHARDIFLFKMTANGTTEWLKTMGGNNDDLATSLAIDGEGNIIMAGTISGNVDFDGTPISCGSALIFVAKYSPAGNRLWVWHGDSTLSRASYYYSFYLENSLTYSFEHQIINDIACDSLNNIYVAGTSQEGRPYQDSLISGDNSMFMGKIGPSGDLIWAKTFGFMEATGVTNRILTVDILPNGNIIAAGGSQLGTSTDGSCAAYLTDGGFFKKIVDPAGNCIEQPTESWGSTNGHYKLRTIPTGGYYSLEYQLYSEGIRTDYLALTKYDAAGIAEWEVIPTDTNPCGCFNMLRNSMYVDAEENIYVAYPVPSTSVTFAYDSYIVKYDSAGTELWSQKIDSVNVLSLTVDNKGFVYLGGLKYGNVLYLGKALDITAHVLSRQINGFVYADDDHNCVRGNQEQKAPSQMLKVMPEGYYISIHDDGSYSAPIDTGTHSLAPVFLAGGAHRISDTCVDLVTVNIVSPDTSLSGFDFGYKIVDCSYLTLQINSGVGLRPCTTPIISVPYSNLGLVDADNVQLKIKLPLYTHLNSASLNYSVAPDSFFIFNIGTLVAGASGTLMLNIAVDCNAPLGLWGCFEGTISPRNICADTVGASPLWDGSYLTVDRLCHNNSSVFTVHNSGESMSDSTQYRLYAQGALYAEGKVKLNSGDSIKIQVSVSTFFSTLEVWQATGCPYDSVISASLTGCRESVPAITAHIDLPVQAPFRTNNETYATACAQIRGSYDPNEKFVTPTGITDHHFVPSKSRLTYFIDFQNTGNDVAFNVIVVDTLAGELDIETFKFLESSHNCRISFSGNRVVIFQFDSIYLPDSSSNLSASIGYFKFAISLKPGVPQGTVVNNEGDIYFDFNSPVRTNAAWVTVKDTVLRYVAPPVSSIAEPGKSIAVYPNPFSSYLTVQLPEGVTSAMMILTDVIGQTVLNTRLNKAFNTIPTGHLARGMYLYYFAVDDKISSGKLTKF